MVGPFACVFLVGNNNQCLSKTELANLDLGLANLIEKEGLQLLDANTLETTVDMVFEPGEETTAYRMLFRDTETTKR